MMRVIFHPKKKLKCQCSDKNQFSKYVYTTKNDMCNLTVCKMSVNGKKVNLIKTMSKNPKLVATTPRSSDL